MQTIVNIKNIRISPRKLRLVADAVRRMKAEEAVRRLRFIVKAGAPIILKAIRSAIANAEHNFDLSAENLYIKEIKVDEAPPLKRWLPRAHGRATQILKRGSYLSITVAEVKDSGIKAGKKPPAEAPVKLTEAPKDGAVKKVAADKQESQDDFDKQTPKQKSDSEEKEIKNTQREGRAGHARIEGGKKGFASRIFRRKSG